MAMNLRALRQRDPNNAALYRYDEAAWWLTGDMKAKADDGVKWVRALVADLKIPASAVLAFSANTSPTWLRKRSTRAA